MKKSKENGPIHPGVLLRLKYLQPNGISIVDAALALKVNRSNLVSLIKGRTGISTLMALRLSKAFNKSPHYWLSLQADHDLWNIKIREKKILANVKSLVDEKEAILMKTAMSTLVEFIRSENQSREKIRDRATLLKHEEMVQIREAFLEGMDYGRSPGSSFDHPDMLYYRGNYG